MLIQKISIDINTKIDKDELIGEFDLLMSFYRRNGQIQGPTESLYVDKNKIVCLPYTLEKEALDKKYNNSYVNTQIKKIESLCNSQCIIKLIGESYSYEAPCTCEQSAFYILITNFISTESPITCGTCNKSVPLYRLPPYSDHGYMPILNWTNNYISCDRLQMTGEVGEPWALNQMEDPTSALSKQGLEICRKVEELTSISTYYYLYNYNKHKGDTLTRPCPSCGEKWGLKTQLHSLYDFKCDRCKIVSTLSLNAK